MVYTRRRGTAIVESPEGILVVSKGGRTFITPGGGCLVDESERDAAIRELMEETGLTGTKATYLFDFMGVVHRGPRGGLFRNAHKVYAVSATGVARPRNEITHLAYYDGTNARLSYSASRILDKYREMRPRARVATQGPSGTGKES